jgi:hypothetical protein
VPLLARVVQSGDPKSSVALEEARQVPEAAHRHDRDTLGLEVSAAPARKRLDRTAVARALDEHDSA